MKKPKEIEYWDFCQTVQIYEGGGCYKTVPEVTRENFEILLESHNNLANIVLELSEKLGVKFDD